MEETIRTELVNGIVSMREEAVCRWHTASSLQSPNNRTSAATWFVAGGNKTNYFTRTTTGLL